MIDTIELDGADDDLVAAYITAALWSSTYGDNGEHHMDDGEHELAPETERAMAIDCLAFKLRMHWIMDSVEAAWEQVGHDFWLTRCGHGAGFWDREKLYVTQATESGYCYSAMLCDISKDFGNVDLYVGDDGLIYQA